MQLFGHPLELVILDVDGVILDLMAGFERHLEAAAGQLHLPTEPIRAYLAAVHHGVRQSYANLSEAIHAWWPALSPSGSRQFKEYFRTIERTHPYLPLFTAIPVRREHAVYVGDWYPDVDTARGGGVRFIAVLSGGILRHAFLQEGIPEDHILARLQDLLGLVRML